MGRKGPRPGTPGYRPPAPRKERIQARIVIDGECWIWTGPTDEKGYGRTFFGSRVDGSRRCLSVHRVAYEEWVGPIPEGMTVDHICERKACCNPAHLQLVTGARNTALRGERMTTCRKGHPRIPENMRVEPSGSIRCIACKREYDRARRLAAA